MSPRAHLCPPLRSEPLFPIAQTRVAAGSAASAGDPLAVPREPPLSAAEPPARLAPLPPPAGPLGPTVGQPGAGMWRILHPLLPGLAAAQRFWESETARAEM